MNKVKLLLITLLLASVPTVNASDLTCTGKTYEPRNASNVQAFDLSLLAPDTLPTSGYVDVSSEVVADGNARIYYEWCVNIGEVVSTNNEISSVRWYLPNRWLELGIEPKLYLTAGDMLGQESNRFKSYSNSESADKDDFFASWVNTEQSNGQFTANVKQRYEGTSSHLGDVYVGIYLSSDSFCSTDDTFLGESGSTLSVNDEVDSEGISFPVASIVNVGRSYLCAIADHRNEFVETSESNNSSYIILEDGEEYTLDPDAPDVIFSTIYNNTDNTFLVSWRSNNLLSNIRFDYSYDNQNWTQFLRIDTDNPNYGEGFDSSIIPESLEHNKVYIKAKFSGWDPDLNNTITSFRKTTELDYTPIVVSLSGLEINGTSSLDENTSANYIAIAKYSDGSSKLVTTQTAWSGSSTSSSVNSTGLLVVGEVSSDSSLILTASYTESGITQAVSKAVVVKNVVSITLSSISIIGLSVIDENSNTNYSAIAHYSDGSSADVEVATWSEDSSFASISTAGQLTTAEVRGDSTINVATSYSNQGLTKTATKAVTIINTGLSAAEVITTIFPLLFVDDDRVEETASMIPMIFDTLDINSECEDTDSESEDCSP